MKITNKKNTDVEKAFSETPPEEIWQALSEKLYINESKSRSPIYLVKWVTGMAASALLFWYFYTPNSNSFISQSTGSTADVYLEAPSQPTVNNTPRPQISNHLAADKIKTPLERRKKNLIRNDHAKNNRRIVKIMTEIPQKKSKMDALTSVDNLVPPSPKTTVKVLPRRDVKANSIPKLASRSEIFVEPTSLQATHKLVMIKYPILKRSVPKSENNLRNIIQISQHHSGSELLVEGLQFIGKEIGLAKLKNIESIEIEF